MSAAAISTRVRLGAKGELEALFPYVKNVDTWQRATLEGPLKRDVDRILRNDPEAIVEITPSGWCNQEVSVRRVPK